MDLKSLYLFMWEKLKEAHINRSGTVEIEIMEFMRLFRLVCDMMQIRNITDSQ